MNIAGTDFSYVLDHAARVHCAVIGADQNETALAHEAARAWLSNNRSMVQNWLSAPTAYDARGLVYRRLLNILRGDNEHASADNRTLLWVIAAGNAWDEEPAHARVDPRWVHADSEGNEAVEIPSGDIYDIARLVEGGDE
jgi:hypothetical protein